MEGVKVLWNIVMSSVYLHEFWGISMLELLPCLGKKSRSVSEIT